MSSDPNYKSNETVTFVWESKIFAMQCNTSAPYCMVSQDGKDVTEENSGTEDLTLEVALGDHLTYDITVQSTSKKTSGGVVTWFRRKSLDSVAVSSEKASWPPQMRFAILPALSFNFLTEDGGEEILPWSDLVLGCDTNGKVRWWLSNKHITLDIDVRFGPIDLENEVYMRIPVDQKEGAAGSDKAREIHLAVRCTDRKEFTVRGSVLDKLL